MKDRLFFIICAIICMLLTACAASNTNGVTTTLSASDAPMKQKTSSLVLAPTSYPHFYKTNHHRCHKYNDNHIATSQDKSKHTLVKPYAENIHLYYNPHYTWFQRFTLFEQSVLKRVATILHPTKSKTILVYANEKLLERPYRIIGTTRIATHNKLGFKRQEETMQKILEHTALSLGGDALVEVEHNDKQILARIIVFEKVVV